MTGFDWGPDDMNPYSQFRGLRPSAILQGEILKYDGSFRVNQVSALSHFVVAGHLQGQKQLDAALVEYKLAEQLDPEFILTHEILAAIYAQMKQPDDAMREYQTAMHIYQTVHPDFQKLTDPPENPLAHP
jgi:tetratricopeptide (TPR) repeat protein